MAVEDVPLAMKCISILPAIVILFQVACADLCLDGCIGKVSELLLVKAISSL